MKNFVIPNSNKPSEGLLSEYLLASLEAFSDATGIPVTYFDANNQINRQFQADNKICKIFDIYRAEGGICRRNLSSAGQFSSLLGEPYIFLCKAGLANIATALIIDGKFEGYFIAGPIIMGDLRNSTVKNFSKLNELDEKNILISEMLASKMKSYLPNEVSKLSLLFYNSIVSSVCGNNDYNKLRQQFGEQNKAGMGIRGYKKGNISLDYPYELEQTLIDNVLNGEKLSARENVKKLLNHFFITETGDFESIKSKAIWLFAVIVRISSQKDNNLIKTMDTDMDIINKLNEVDSFNRLVSTSEEIVESITKNMLASVYEGHSNVITKALQYINQHYNQPISLKDIEKNLHVNSSYFSTLFRREMGITFTDYLNELKINHACNLLVDTNLNIIDISLSTGFEDQSYFTKVFKKIKGVSPKAYRIANSKQKIEK